MLLFSQFGLSQRLASLALATEFYDPTDAQCRFGRANTSQVAVPGDVLYLAANGVRRWQGFALRAGSNGLELRRFGGNGWMGGQRAGDCFLQPQGFGGWGCGRTAGSDEHQDY